jgi:[acyl-carrier-protein] S-malonyltransferase
LVNTRLLRQPAQSMSVMRPASLELAARRCSRPCRSAIKRGLVGQVTAMVRWRESIMFLAASGVGEIVEIGAGRVLTGLVKRIVPALSVRSAGIPAEVHALIEGL